MLVQATGAPAFSAACSGGSLASQRTARKRRPVTFPAASETSHTRGGAMTSGWIIWARSKPASSDTIGVLVIPPGTRLVATDQGGTDHCRRRAERLELARWRRS